MVRFLKARIRMSAVTKSNRTHLLDNLVVNYFVLKMA